MPREWGRVPGREGRGLLLQRWRAELSTALVMGDAEVYMAALDGRPCASFPGGLAPADVQVYDLRSCRVGSA